MYEGPWHACMSANKGYALRCISFSCVVYIYVHACIPACVGCAWLLCGYAYIHVCKYVCTSLYKHVFVSSFMHARPLCIYIRVCACVLVNVYFAGGQLYS